MAIESTNFFSFLQQTRSPIGLVDQYNLSEIYDSDQREALENLLLNPDGLDQIYNLSKGEPPVIKEDIRLIGGLESPVIESLALFDETKPRISFDLSQQVRVGADVGDPGKQSYISPSQSDNLVIYHGGLAAKNIEYSYLDLDGNVKTTSVSTSRESLFNSQNDSDGNFTVASYPGLIRVRRRGHYNKLKLNAKLFVTKGNITETPNAIMKIPTFMRTNNNTNPNVSTLDAYATKNSPLEIPIKVLGSGSFNLGTITQQSEPYFFGFEIKRKSDNAVVVTKPYEGNTDALKPIDLSGGGASFNLSGTIGDNKDCILSIYCAPNLIKMLDLSGLNISEDAGKDLGLVGFDALEEVYLQNNDLKNIPTWLKVNYKTLRVLNLENNPFWNNGPVEYFDHQDDINKSQSNTGDAPLLSATQILSYSGFHDSSSTEAGVDTNGKIEFYEGLLDTVVDGTEAKGSTTDATRFIQGRARDVGGLTPVCDVDEDRGFRVFSNLEVLQLSSSFKLRNADFSKVFPELLNLDLRRNADGGERTYGSLPKINNNLNEAGINYDLHLQDNSGGNIRWVGGEATYDDTTADAQTQFIGKFLMKSWDTYRRDNPSKYPTGGICTDDTMIAAGKVDSSQEDGINKYSLATGGSANKNASAVEAWSGWLEKLENLTIRSNDIAFNIAEGNQTLQWKRLKSVNIIYTGYKGVRDKVKYNQTPTGNPLDTYGAGDLDAYDILYANSLTKIDGWQAGWGGRIFSIEKAEALKTLEWGKIKWKSYLDTDGSKYILPNNFVDRSKKTNLSEQHPISRLAVHYLIDGGSEELQFRPDEFLDMSNLTSFECRESYYWGVYPAFCNETQTTTSVSTWLGNNRFYDLSNLGTSKNNRFSTIWAPNQGNGRGGAIIPNFNTFNKSNNKLYHVEFTNSLYSKYDATWHVSSKANNIVFSALKGVPGVPTTQNSVDPVAWGDIDYERNGISGVTFTAKNRAGAAGSSRIIYADQTDTLLLKYVRVGDTIWDAASGGSQIGRVHQVRNGSGAYIVVDENKTWSGKTLYFQRAGIDASTYFKLCTALRYVYLQNCSLVGTIPDFSGSNKQKLERVRFQDNLLTTYVPGTLDNITGKAIGDSSRPAIKEFNLRRNPISINSIRDIIKDAFEVAKFHNNNFNGTFQIDLRDTKANISEEKFTNYTLDEIFYNRIEGDPNSEPPLPAIPDPLETDFNQLGSGNKYSKVKVLIN